MTSPLVSVIVPNYNHAKYLQQRLDSIFHQTFQDFEVIILDDCSTDNSKEIIEEYHNRPQVSHIVYNETNSGSPFKQWAKGFDLAQGEYIWIAESDDWAELNFLEETTRRLKVNDVNLVFTNSYIVTPNEKKIDIPIKEDTFLHGRSFLQKEMIFHNFILNASAVLFKKKALQSIPKTYQTFTSSGDWLFWIEFCLIGNVFYCAKILNYNNRHGMNTTAQWGKKMSSGTASCEDCIIHHYLKANSCIPFFHQHTIPLSNIEWIDNNRFKFDSEKVYETIRNRWKKELFSETFSLVIRFAGIKLYNLLKALRIIRD
ncbi:MAG: glycosyltransferase [Fibrobacter sp.]|nr:glycosyltransferase [Fibrobacter sp.]